MKRWKVIGAIAVFSLFLELIVFQINSFHLWGKNVNKEELKLENAVLSGIEQTDDGTYRITQPEASIEFQNIDKKVETICFDISGERADYTTRIFYTDEAAQYYNTYYDLVQAKSIVHEVERTKYFTCHFVRKGK